MSNENDVDIKVFRSPQEDATFDAQNEYQGVEIIGKSILSASEAE